MEKNVKAGDKYGVLTIISEMPKINGSIVYLVKCECGNEKIVYRGNLLKWNYHKCSCVRKNKGGLSNSPLYSVWRAMLNRCSKPNSHGFKWYGGKGIKVCEEWANEYTGYVNFYNWSINNGYKEIKLPSGRNKLTIDRIDGTKGYCPDNCRWVEYETQLTNLPKLCTNKSGYVGVSWSKQEKKWICVISIKSHSKRIGGFATQKEAVEARNKFIEDNKLPHTKNVYIGELNNGY